MSLFFLLLPFFFLPSLFLSELHDGKPVAVFDSEFGGWSRLRFFFFDPLTRLVFFLK